MSNPPRQFVSIEPLERRRLFTGVTLITHGFGGSADGWVTTMGNLVAQQSGPLANQPRYRMTARDSGNGTPITVSSTRVSGAPSPAQAASREIVVLLDWSALAGSLFGGHWRNTAEVGAAVANKLVSQFSIPDLATPLAELPIHLLGHSRGASLVSEIARGLGQRGAWVDHVTYFDPHPVDHEREPFLGPNYGDAAMRVYDNVIFADNYWRTDGPNSFDFTGESVNGAYNLQLTESKLTGGYSNDHSDTHLFYHGTIGPVGGPFQNGDGPDGGGTTMGAGWYTPPHPSRETTGWRYSRIAASGTRPAAGSKFSAGVHRDALTLTASGANVWDNVQINALLADFSLVEGQPITVPVQWADANDDAVVTIGFDRDDNPYNGVFARGGASITTSNVAGDASLVQLDTTGIAGRFHVYAKVTNGTNARYYYAPARATIAAAGGFDNTWVGPASGNWSDAGNWSANAAPTVGQKVAIYDSAVTLASNARLAGLHLNDTAKLDLRASTLLVDYDDPAASPIAPLTALLAAGRTPGSDWSGETGIVSSVAAASAQLTTLGISEAATAVGYSTTDTATFDFAGQVVDCTTVVIKYTYDGDVDLNGFVDAVDYGTVDNWIQFPGTTGYCNGDFNLDGVIDAVDYGIIDNSIQLQGEPL